MQIDLLRHGETTAGQCFIGSCDVLLTPNGWSQMQVAVVEQKYDLIICSPLSRCLDFVKQYSTDTGISHCVEQDFREYDFGAWEGKTSEELWATQRAMLSAFWADPCLHTPPGGEDFQQFQYRINTAINKHIQACKGKRVLLVAHAGVIRQIMMSLLNKSWQQAMKIRVAHGERIRLCMTDNGMRMQDDCYICDYM